MRTLCYPSIIFSFFMVSCVLYCQEIRTDPDSILVGNKKLPTVLLVGSFHFAYYNLDSHVTDKDKQVNVLSELRQKEMNELVDYVARFKPNKIVVEAGRNTGWLMKYYNAYLRGERELKPDEREQIGFRLMKKFKLDTLYGADARTLVFDLSQHKDSAVLHPIIDSIYNDWDFKDDGEISMRYSDFYRWNDDLILKHTLLEYFKYLNSDKVLDRGHGAYLTGDFELGDTRGADALSMFWYSRNLRIFRNIQQITTSPDDRILVLFGAGHMGILKHLFECSPQYSLVKFNEL